MYEYDPVLIDKQSEKENVVMLTRCFMSYVQDVQALVKLSSHAIEALESLEIDGSPEYIVIAKALYEMNNNLISDDSEDYWTMSHHLHEKYCGVAQPKVTPGPSRAGELLN